MDAMSTSSMSRSPPPSSPLSRWLRRLTWLLGGLALAATTLWTGAYFWLGSSPGRAQLLSLAKLPHGVTVGAVRWGPAPDEIALGDLSVRDPHGRTVARIASASADLGLGALLGGEVVVDALEVEVSHVEAVADDEGRVDLIAALTPPPPAAPTVAGGPAAEPRPKPRISSAVIYVGAVWIDLAGLQADVRDLRLRGSLAGSAGTGELEIVGRGCEATWNKARRRVGFDECRVSLSVDGPEVVVSALELKHHEEVLSLEGSISFGDQPSSRWRGWGRLGPREADALLPGPFPAGFDFAGLELVIDSEQIVGRLGVLMAPRWSSGPFSADHVALSIAHADAKPKRLIPELEMSLDGLAAARLEGLGWSFEGLWAPYLVGDLQRRLDAAASGWAASWTLPTGEVGPVDIRLMTGLKLTGGRIDAQVETAQGTVAAVGTLKSSPLTKRTSFVAELGFQDVSGALGKALLHDLSSEQLAALGEMPFGSAELDVEVDREDREAPWETTLEWALGHLESSREEARATLEWDGYAWDVATPVAELPQDPGEESP